MPDWIAPFRKFRNMVREANKPLRRAIVPHNSCFEFYQVSGKEKWYGHTHGDKYVVVLAADIMEALKHCRKAHPDLVILGLYCHSLIESGDRDKSSHPA